MTEYKDLQTMIEIISLVIVRQETEEEFFRRSAGSSTSEVAKTMFSEIADDLARYRKSLEDRKDKLLTALDDLKKTREGKDAPK